MTNAPSRPPSLFRCTAIVASFAAYWAVANFPTPAHLLSAHGQGYQLAAAMEILSGRQPVLDFDETYGPLAFYASALAQWATGTRVIGEIGLISAAFAWSYALLFLLMLACGVGQWCALATALAAVLAQPVGFRYYLLLCPLLVLAAAWRYLAVPSRNRLALTALAVTVAGLFRPDLGVYGFVAAVVALGTSDIAGRFRETLRLSAMVVAWAAPWLIWVALHGKLGDYLYISSFEAVVEAVGRSKPAPWPDFSAGVFTDRNAKAFLFRLPLIMLAFSGLILALRWRATRGTQRARLLSAFAFAAMGTLLASHVVDWIHVRDTFPVRFLLLGWVAAGAAAAGSWWRRVATWLATCLLAGSAVGGSVVRETERTASPLAWVAKLREFGRPRSEVLAGVRARRESFRAELYEYVRDHSRPDETVFAVLECPQLNYFADRRFASRQMAIFPGYFASVGAQQRMMAEIRRGPTVFVVIDHLEMMDYPAGAMQRFAPDVLRFLKDEFVLVKQIGYCRVLMPRWRTDAPRTGPSWWDEADSPGTGASGVRP